MNEECTLEEFLRLEAEARREMLSRLNEWKADNDKEMKSESARD
jgi:hypothetical protein